jgi:hypothetical protein
VRCRRVELDNTRTLPRAREEKRLGSFLPSGRAGIVPVAGDRFGPRSSEPTPGRRKRPAVRFLRRGMRLAPVQVPTKYGGQYEASNSEVKDRLSEIRFPPTLGRFRTGRRLPDRERSSAKRAEATAFQECDGREAQILRANPTIDSASPYSTRTFEKCLGILEFQREDSGTGLGALGVRGDPENKPRIHDGHRQG